MKMMLRILSILLILYEAYSTPVNIVSKRKCIDDVTFTESKVLYEAENDIVEINIPLFLKEDEGKLFFVQADTANKKYEGIFALSEDKTKNKTTTRLLDNGQCIASDNKTVYFGATDGIYTYNFETNKAEKYGSITADIIDIEKDSLNDLLYIITKQNQLYKVTEQGTKMSLDQTTTNVGEILLGKQNQLYFMEKVGDTKKYKKPKVMIDGNVTEIEGLPDEYDYMKFVKFYLADGALLVMNHDVYAMFPNGTSIMVNEFCFNERPTAYFMETGMIQLYAHNKKIYYFTILELVIEALINEIGNRIGNRIREMVTAFSDALKTT